MNDTKPTPVHPDIYALAMARLGVFDEPPDPSRMVVPIKTSGMTVRVAFKLREFGAR